MLITLLPLNQHHISGYFHVQVPADLHCDSYKNSYNFIKGDYVNIAKAMQDTDWEFMFNDSDL